MSEASALELRDALRAGAVTALELAEAALERIAARRELGAFISVQTEQALAEAAAADRLIAATPPEQRGALPPLTGLPTAHKDLVRVRGAVTTHGSAAVPHLEATVDDPVAAAVRSGGAISVGKTQVPEFGIAAYSENLIADPARNPHSPERTAGGSSGGTAAAVAEGLLPAAIGSDAGGSIRIPAAACGLIGLKPGRGAVPADLASAGLPQRARTAGRGSRAALLLDETGAPRMGVTGPLARTALDAALFYDAITAGPSARGGDGPALTAVRRAGELRGLRIGVSLASPFETAMPIRFDRAALDALERATRILEALGHHPEVARIAYDPAYPEAFGTVWPQSLTRGRFDEPRLGALARHFLESARAAEPHRVAAAAETLCRFARDAERQWGAYDAVLTPALAFTAPEVGEFERRGPEGDFELQCQWVPQTSMVNVAGLPAVAVPIGLDGEGLPRGVQLIGRAGDELRLLQLAAQLTG